MTAQEIGRQFARLILAALQKQHTNRSSESMVSMSRRFPAVLRNPPYDLRVAARLDDHLSWATAGS